MKCVRCNKNEATVYYKQNINGEITESALCEECAEKLRAEYEKKVGKQFDSIFDTVYDGFFAPFDDMNLLGNIFGTNHVGRIAAAKKCSLCGSTLRDIVENGKAGCAECYRTFRDELEDSIERIHGSIKHKGRAPRNFRIKLDREEKIKELKCKLESAIEKQEFEDAAKLRDEIKKLESENENNENRANA